MGLFKLSVITSTLVLLVSMLASCAAPTTTPPPSSSQPIPAPTPVLPPKMPEKLELNLVETAPPSHQLDVRPIYAGHNVCFFGSLAMLLKYDDPSLDFCDCVGYGSIGPGGDYGRQAPIAIKFKVGFRWWPAMALAPRYLGYGLIVGIAKGGRIDVTPDPSKKQPPIEQRAPDLKNITLEAEAKRIEYFSNVDEAFDFLKRVVASGYPVEVHLEVSHVMHDFARASSHWAENAAIFRGDISHHMVVTGYDTEYVYLNDPTDPGRPTNLPTTITNFKSAWDVPEGLMNSDTGPYWMLFVKKMTEKESVDDILAWNKQISLKTPSDIRLFSQDPPLEFKTWNDKRYFYVIAEMRQEYAKFLAKNGRGEAAELYEQSSKLWEGLYTSSNMSGDLKKIAELEEQAQGLY